jgi:zinc protease
MMFNGKKVQVLLMILLAILLCGQSQAATDCFSTLWPHEKSDLQTDPALVFGRLDNGFRYVLMHNGEPRNRVAMSLNVQAGSLNETAEQRGIAHFLEHMLFNGSTHFPPGELVEYFQSIGMSFGGDTNAHTSYDETVYDIILPQGSPEDIDKGLLVFSDYARGALLLTSEIDRERGVILAEKRSRDSAEYRAHVKETEFSMEGTLIPERMPIGTLATLNGADRALMKSFYDAWYRPENMVLVMVGDFDPQRIKPLIEKRFSAMKGEGEQPLCPDLGALQGDGTDYFYHHESEMGNSEIGIESLWPETPEDDSFELERRELTGYLANKIVQYRLDELASKSDTPFTTANIYSGVFLGKIAYAEISAKSDPDKWQQSLQVIENTLRQALKYGFTDVELHRVKKEIISELESAVLTADSRNSRSLASTIVRHLNRNRVMQSPQQEVDLWVSVLAAMSRESIEARFREIWSHSRRSIKVNGNAVLAGDSLKTIKEAYDQARSMTLGPYKETAVHAFPYLQLRDTHPVVKTEIFDAIEAKRYIFGNGLILNLKKTDFEPNSIEVSADFGWGRVSEPQPGLAMLTEAVVGLSGTAQMDKNGIDQVVSGSSVKLGFTINPASFNWQAKGLNKDTELLFQVLQSLLADPGVDADAFAVSMERYKQFYKGLSSDVRGVLKLKGDSFLADGHPGFGLPSWEDFSQLTQGQVEEWFLSAMSHSALEISIVGDFDEAKLLDLVEKYFSVLPLQKGKEMAVDKVTFPAGKSLALTLPSSIDKGVLLVAWKSDDFWDIQRTRGLHLLAEVFSDKMRRVIREKLGASYSPQVYNVSSRIYKGYGVIQAVLIVDPAQIDVLKKEVLKIAGGLWQGQISENELERAKGPMLTTLNDMVRSNGYWLKSVLALSARHPEQLQWPQSILQSFSDFTVQDIRGLGKAYLNPEKAAVITIVPAP